MTPKHWAPSFNGAGLIHARCLRCFGIIRLISKIGAPRNIAISPAKTAHSAALIVDSGLPSLLVNSMGQLPCHSDQGDHCPST